MRTAWSQSFPPHPTFRSKSVPNLSGKVSPTLPSPITHRITQTLGIRRYRILVRNRLRARQDPFRTQRWRLHHRTIFRQSQISTQVHQNRISGFKGKDNLLAFGLKVIKASVEEFLGIEERLDVLWNNAGVLTPPIGAITMQVCCIVRTLLSISSH